MSIFSDFGLDENKIAKDPDAAPGRSYCLWCNGRVDGGFAMCFSDFVICQACANSATMIENQDRWSNAPTCDKCHTKDVIGYRSHPDIMEWNLCKDCIDWSKSVLLKQATTVQAPSKLLKQMIAQKCNLKFHLYEEYITVTIERYMRINKIFRLTNNDIVSIIHLIISASS